jgi:hypothetical protein
MMYAHHDVFDPRSSGWQWHGLCIGPSQQCKVPNATNLGVFASDEGVSVGLCIPIIGIAVPAEDVADMTSRNDATHLFTTTNERKLKEVVDCRPIGSIYRGVGVNGQAIAGMINEPRRGVPNCVIRGNDIVVAKDLDGGVELTVSYGAEYVRNYQVSVYCLRKCRYAKLDRLVRRSRRPPRRATCVTTIFNTNA